MKLDIIKKQVKKELYGYIEKNSINVVDNFCIELTIEETLKAINYNHSVSNTLPTKDEVIAEGNKQIKDWLSENSEHDQRVYRVAFRRSFEYILRFIK